MKTIRTLAPLLCALCVISMPTAVRAEMASGNYTNVFSGVPALWDISGTYSESVEGIDLDYTINVDPSGKFTGAGTFSLGSDGFDHDLLQGDFTVNGSVKSAGDVVRIMLTFQLTGAGNISGYDVTFSAKMKEKLEIASVTREMVGTVSGSVKVTVPAARKSKSAKIPSTDISVQLPYDVDGDWSLLLNVIPNGTKYTGTAKALFSTGKAVDLGLTGVYSLKTGTSKILLKGLAPAKSVSLNLVTSCIANQLNIQSLKAKALGQKLKIQ